MEYTQEAYLKLKYVQNMPKFALCKAYMPFLLVARIGAYAGCEPVISAVNVLWYKIWLVALLVLVQFNQTCTGPIAILEFYVTLAV